MKLSEECTIFDVCVSADMPITRHHIPEDSLFFKTIFIQILEQKTNPLEILSLHYY